MGARRPRRRQRQTKTPQPQTPSGEETQARQEWRAAERRVQTTRDWFLALAERVAPGGGFGDLLAVAWTSYSAKHGVPPFDPNEGLAEANGNSGDLPKLDDLRELIYKLKIMYDAIMELAADHGFPPGPGSTGAVRTIEDGSIEPERHT